MDENVLVTAGILGVVCLGLVISAVTRSRPSLDDEVATGQPQRLDGSPIYEELGDPLRPKHDHPWAFTILGLALVANGVLGVLVFNLSHDLGIATEQISDAVREGEEAIDLALAQALAAIPDVSELERSDREQQSDIDEHSRLLDQLTSGFGAAIDPTDIDTPFFCAGEPAYWGRFGGLGC